LEGMDLMGRSPAPHPQPVIAALVAAIQRKAGSGAWGWLDCGDKPRNDMVCCVLGILADLCEYLRPPGLTPQA